MNGRSILVGTVKTNKKQTIAFAIAGLVLLAAFLVSRVTVRYELVGNHTAVAAHCVEVALECYKLDHGDFPPADAGLDLLAVNADGTALDEPYMTAVPRDAWDRAFRWQMVDGSPHVTSAGPDGVHETEDDIVAGGARCRRRYVLRLW